MLDGVTEETLAKYSALKALRKKVAVVPSIARQYQDGGGKPDFMPGYLP